MKMLVLNEIEMKNGKKNWTDHVNNYEPNWLSISKTPSDAVTSEAMTPAVGHASGRDLTRFIQ